ncbi:hypothetical protein HK098_005028 [Nowakowskiella sp. JEL0407]|nr:hypothetical protein HK098_005028 [Nowakowskiella sp. JEL0407]
MSSIKDSKDYTDVETTLNRINSHTGVQGIVIASHDGSVIKSTLDNIQTQQYSMLVTQLATKAMGVVRDLDPEVCSDLERKKKYTGK